MRTLIEAPAYRINDEFTGLEGTVDKVVRQGQEWRVRIQGSFWTACSEVQYILNQGDRIKVLYRDTHKLRLVIEPL